MTRRPAVRRPHTRPRTPVLGALVLAVGLLGLVLGGCEEDVVAVLGTDRIYTLYGFFNPVEDVQAVRVVPIEGILVPTGDDPIDAVVTSTELETGQQVVWQDSLIRYPSGAYGHVFWAPFEAVHTHTYRLDVARSDGAGASVQVTVPPLSEPEVGEADPGGFDLEVPVLWRDAPRLIDIEVRYVSDVAGTSAVFYGTRQEVGADGVTVKVAFREDTRVLLLEAFSNGLGPVEICYIEMTVVVANAEWDPPLGLFEPDVLVEPGTFSNVENGFGFVGAGYPATVRWIPSDAVLNRAGFVVNEPSCRPSSL